MLTIQSNTKPPRWSLQSLHSLRVPANPRHVMFQNMF